MLIKNFKKFFPALIFLFSLLFITHFFSCDENDEVNKDDCTGCTTSAPWSKPGTGNCYATQAECEAAEGPGCVLCD
jgi:hypothetical protein